MNGEQHKSTSTQTNAENTKIYMPKMCVQPDALLYFVYADKSFFRLSDIV